MMTKGRFSFLAGLTVVLLSTSCLAGAKKETLRVASLDQPATAAQVLYEKPAVLGDKEAGREIIAMGRRVEEEVVKVAPVLTSLRLEARLPRTCKSFDACPINLTIENKGSVPVVSPILNALTLGASGGALAATKTTGWTCGYADPKLTCASTGIALQPGEKTSYVIDWTPPEVKAKQNTKICANLVWPGRPPEGIYRADQIAAVQFALTRAGFETGGIDGRIRPKTLQAIRLLREAANIPGPPQITPDLLSNLFGEVGKLSHDADSVDDQACTTVDLMPGEKKPDVIAAVTPTPKVEAPAPAPAPAPAVKAPEPVKTVTPVITPAPAPKVEEKKEAPKPAAPAPEKKVEEAKPVPTPVAPAPKAETKPASSPAPAPKAETKPVSPAPKVEAKPAPAPAPKVEAKIAPPAPAPKAEAKPAAPKIADRLPQTETTPKSTTVVRSTVAPEAYPVIDVPVVEEEAVETLGNELVIISTETPQELFYHRDTEERGPAEYYVVDRGEDTHPKKIVTACTCESAVAPPKAAPARKRVARKAKTEAKAKPDYIPTALEIMNGWPYNTAKK